MKAVWKHELSLYYNSMTAYVFGAFLLIATGLGALLYNINASVANFEYVLSFISMIMVILVPLLTMKTIAEEKKQKTDQLIYSLPISTTSVVLGKFFALVIVLGIPMIIISFYPLLFRMFGDLYLPTSYGSILAFFIMGMAMMALGMFLSSLMESQGMAAGIGVVLLLFNYYSTSLADYVSKSALGSLIMIIVLMLALGLILRYLTKADVVGIVVSGITILASVILYLVDASILEGLLPNVMKELSLFDHFYTFVNGVFDLTDIVFYLSVMVFFLFLTVQSLEKRRYS